VRILIDVDPVRLGEMPRLEQGISLVFGDHTHPAFVRGIEYLEDGKMRLACEIAARLVGWNYEPAGAGEPTDLLPS
jgi:hypothetical protein